MINKQPNPMDCGFVGIHNTLQLTGHKVNYKDTFKFGVENLEYLPKHGMLFYEIEKGLDLLGISYEMETELNTKRIEELLDQGHIIMYMFRWHIKGKNGGHFCVIESHTDKRFKVWNYYGSRCENKTPWITKKTLQKDIKYSLRHHRKYYSWGLIVKVPK